MHQNWARFWHVSPPLASAITGANRRRLPGGHLRQTQGRLFDFAQDKPFDFAQDKPGPPFPGATPGRVRPLCTGYPATGAPRKRLCQAPTITRLSARVGLLLPFTAFGV